MPFDKNEYMRKYMKGRDTETNRNNRLLRALKLDEIKESSGCYICGESDPRCLDFHHRDPEQKVAAVSVLTGHGVGWEKVLEEVEKCDVICANCRRKLHKPDRRTGR